MESISALVHDQGHHCGDEESIDPSDSPSLRSAYHIQAGREDRDGGRSGLGNIVRSTSGTSSIDELSTSVVIVASLEHVAGSGLSDCASIC